jgi:hypothetical protein
MNRYRRRLDRDIRVTKRHMDGSRHAWRPVVLAALWVVAGCGAESEPVLPSPEDIASYYSYEGQLKADLSGNVATVTVSQPASQLRSGGSLWAKVGPYVVLFSEETHRLLEEYPDLAGVRVVTEVAGGPEVARALLTRTELTGVLWRRALNIAGRARRDGTRQPSLLEDLVRWGEEHTEFAYNPRYAER